MHLELDYPLPTDHQRPDDLEGHGIYQTLKFYEQEYLKSHYPYIEIVPSFAFSNPVIAFNSVVFPAPLGPITATISPSFTSIDTLCKADA